MKKKKKKKKNKFGNYKYRSCEDILEAVKSILPDSTYIHIADRIVLVGDRVYVEATATLSHNDDHISTTAYAREPLSKKGMDEAQVTGATSSYARKYALNGLFCIDDTKDADSQDNSKSSVAEGNRRTHNKDVDKWFNTQLASINNALDMEELQALYTEIYKECKTKGVTDDQFAMLEQQKDNRKEFITAKG